MRIAAQGFRYIGASLVLGAACLFLPAARPLAVVFFALAAFVTFFFRDPHRVPPDDPKVLVSAGDGRVVIAGPVEDDPTRKQVTIFLSLFDVHVNRSPLSGSVEGVRYRPGRFLAAYRSEAGKENERNEIEIADGDFRVLVRQIAGVVARRIVCTVRKDDRLGRGERFGLIQFGSRLDVVLPGDATVEVRVGEHVRGGESVIARRP